MKHLPPQKLPASKKTLDWQKKSINAIIDMSATTPFSHGKYSELQSYYGYYNGEIDPEEYTYVLSPYGKSRHNFPAQLRNYNIIKPTIDVLLGEKAKRPLKWNILLANSDVTSIKEEAEQAHMLQGLSELYLRELARLGVDSGADPEQELPSPEELNQAFHRTYKDQRAIMAEHALRYIILYQDVYNKVQDLWFHLVVSGEVYTYRGIDNDDVTYEVLNPLEVDYDKDPETKFVEDGEWALVRRMSYPSAVVDRLHRYLSDDDIVQIQSPKLSNQEGFFFNNRASSSDTVREEARLVEYYEVYWRSFKKVGFLTYMDDYGQAQEMIVPEGYKAVDDQILEWGWVSDIWGGIRVDEDIFVKMGPIANQQVSLDNVSRGKLPINGRRLNDVNSKNTSLVSLGKPYQLIYNVYKFRLENAIAKSKDIVASINLDQIPKDWKMEKFLYYMDALGIMFYQQKEGTMPNAQHQGVLDLSIKTIESYLSLLNSIIVEWERLSGISRQRQGDIGPYELKSTTEQAIVQSSHITEDMFRKMAQLEQRDLQALVNLSKTAWKQGKKGSYIMDEAFPVTFEINEEYSEADIGIFVASSSKEQEAINAMKSLAAQMSQSGTPASMLADIMTAESMTMLKDKIRVAEQHAEQLQQAQQEAEQQMKQEMMQAEQAARDHQSYENELDRQNKIDIALIGAGSKEMLKDDGTKDHLKLQLEQQKIALSDKHATRNLDETKRSNQANEQLKRMAIAVQRHKAAKNGTS